MLRDWALYLAIMALVLVTAWTWAESADAQQPKCFKRHVFLETAKKRYGEHPAFAGLTGDGKHVLEILLNPETGSWTVTITDMYGNTCPTTGGDGWVDRRPSIKIGEPT
jgi:hypothetical protein